MGRHTDPAAVMRRATVLTLAASVLLVAGGVAILRSSGGIGSPGEHPTATHPPVPTGSVPPEPTMTPTATPTSTPATASPTPTTPTTERPGAGSPAREAARSSPRSTGSSTPPAAVRPTPSPQIPKDEEKGPGADRLAQQVVTFVNVERAKAGCQPVEISGALQRAALTHSAEMAAYGYVSHTGLDGSTATDRAGAAGYGGPVAENVAAGPSTAKAVMKTWMSSPAHRASIMDCRFTAIGVGVATGGSLGSYWTQDLGG
jgi:uncharacterized protein YkwD